MDRAADFVGDTRASRHRLADVKQPTTDECPDHRRGYVAQVILGAILLKWEPGIAAISAFSDGVKSFLKLS